MLIAEKKNKNLSSAGENAREGATISTTGDITNSATIDTADIHSDDSARHIEKAEEKITERVVDKETGSWKIKKRTKNSNLLNYAKLEHVYPYHINCELNEKRYTV